MDTMKRFFLLAMLSFAVSLPLPTAAQNNKKTRNVAETSESAVSARKLSVKFTEGLKAYYAANTAEALSVFNGIVLDNPKHDAAWFMLAKIAKDRKDYADAINALRKALKIDKNNVWYKVEMAKLYALTDDYAYAAKLWEQVCKEKDNNEYYLYALAECYMSLNKTEKIIETYDRMENLMGSNDEITRVKASLWLYMDKVKEAVNEYDKLIKIYPHNAEFYVKAGFIYQSNDMLDKAYPYFAKAQELTPDDPDLNLILSAYWEQQQRPDKMMDAIRKVFENPNVGTDVKKQCIHIFMAAAVKSDASDEEMSRAEELADLLIRMNPDFSEGYLCKARLCIVRKNYADALPLYEKSLQYDNTAFGVWEDYFYVLDSLKQWKNLLKYEQEVQELFPQSNRVLYSLGKAYLEVNEPDRAVEYFKQAMSYSFTNNEKTVIYKALGEAYHQMGDEKAAAMYWKKAGQR